MFLVTISKTISTTVKTARPQGGNNKPTHNKSHSNCTQADALLKTVSSSCQLMSCAQGLELIAGTLCTGSYSFSPKHFFCADAMCAALFAVVLVHIRSILRNLKLAGRRPAIKECTHVSN